MWNKNRAGVPLQTRGHKCPKTGGFHTLILRENKHKRNATGQENSISDFQWPWRDWRRNTGNTLSTHRRLEASVTFVTNVNQGHGRGTNHDGSDLRRGYLRPSTHLFEHFSQSMPTIASKRMQYKIFYQEGLLVAAEKFLLKKNSYFSRESPNRRIAAGAVSGISSVPSGSVCLSREKLFHCRFNDGTRAGAL